jgi:hypothetical protein
MPAPKNPNTAAATAAVIRRGQETRAARLREAGWIILRPEEIADLRDQSDIYVAHFIRGLMPESA